VKECNKIHSKKRIVTENSIFKVKKYETRADSIGNRLRKYK
jgi:hypothetical protein